jgi:hypothetical protein
VDGGFRVIRVLERLGLVWGVRRVPADKLRPPGAVAPAYRPVE